MQQRRNQQQQAQPQRRLGLQLRLELKLELQLERKLELKLELKPELSSPGTTGPYGSGINLELNPAVAGLADRERRRVLSELPRVLD